LSLSLLERLRRRLRGTTAPPPDPNAYFGLADIDELHATYRRHGTRDGGPWDRYRHAHLRLPDWFENGLDPWSDSYRQQQHRLWQAVAGVDRPYEAGTDEADTGWERADPIRRPGFFQRRDDGAVDAAAHQILASGMIHLHSGLRPGDRALEYGPGFGQTALSLARLGVRVDAVDISPRFCEFVNAQGRHFEVELHAHVGRFGDNPHPGQRYRLVWFYEAFHHAFEFDRLVAALDGLVEPGGRVILAGEPIVEREYAAVPYPWGLRLHSEVVAVVRQTGWFELGFSEAFLFELFARHGWQGRKVACEPSPFGVLFCFERRVSPAAGT
jgi:2-polyprenyl-3-methyl-5-hydroxy-6-metoxy-1,4-benzoquinol methylase